MSAKILADKINYIKDDNNLDDLMRLFDMHNLIPELSKSEHAYANTLAMLVKSLNWHGHIRHLFESLPYTKGREIDLLDIINTMSHLGFTSHTIEMDLKEIDDRLMPCLFLIKHKKETIPLVLLEKEGEKIIAYHGQKGCKIEFTPRSLHGDAYFFEKLNPDELSEELQTKKSAGLTWFHIVFQKFKGVIREIVFSSVLINMFALAMPLFIMTIYDKVIGSGSMSTLFYLVIGVMIAFIAQALLKMFRIRYIVWLGSRFDNIVSNTIFERLLLMRASYTEIAPISSQISRLKTFESLRRFFTGPLFMVIVELPFTIILLTVIWLLTGILVLIPIGVLFLYGVIIFYYQSKVRVAMRASSRCSARRQQFGMETFMKMHALHYNGMSRIWIDQYKEKLSRSVTASFKINMISGMIDTIGHAISMLSGVGVVTVGVYLIWNNQITVGALVATMILIWRVLNPLQTICSMLPRLEQIKGSIDQINRLVNIEVERQAMVMKRPIEHLEGNISMHNVGIRYSSEVEPIFVGLEINIKQGEVIAVTGVNGSGKSSILKLISGLYKAQAGTIRIDGINIKQLEPIELRNYMGYQPQVPNFFAGTVKENLLLANPLATDKEIKEAMVRAACYEDIMSLQHGLETNISGINTSLPNGFADMLNLVRVMLKKTNILLLDSMPNSALNGRIGAAFERLIVESKGKKTVIFVTQRDDHIQLADRVIALKPGNRPVIMKSKEFINQYVQK